MEILEYMQGVHCLVPTNEYFMEATRPQFDCNVCNDIKSFPIVNNITEDEFIHKYAYTAVPLLVRNAVQQWSALKIFSFDYFKEIYTTDEDVILKVESDCQFFPYSTEFQTLGEVFRMSKARSLHRPEEKPWYIGW
jgi:hypothetical protein